MGEQSFLLTGNVVGFAGSPFEMPPEDALQVQEAVIVRNGVIADVGALDALQPRASDLPRIDRPGHLISAGFVDAHVHFPQTAMIASWGKRLIDWLNTYTFPEESRFADAGYASEIAARYLDLTMDAGTTTICSFATIHPESVDAFFAEAQRRNQRVVTGKTCMDRNAPENLRDTAQSAYDDSKRLLERWHGVDRLSYAITPRFSPTSTPDQLAALGALWSEHPDCLMQTHLSEQTDEIEWVRSLYPQARDYLDTYEGFGLLGQNGLYGHAIHLESRERDRLREVGAALIHCPTSNTFIGSGLFDMAGLKGDGHRVGLATDTGGGSSFSMLRTMAAAYEVAQLRGTALHPAQLLWLATEGSAETLGFSGRIGRIAKGVEADLITLSPDTAPALAQRCARASTVTELLFAMIMLGDDRTVRDVWIAGDRRKGG